MSIYAIGHDIVENSRIKCLFEKYSTHFILKVLSKQEQEIVKTKSDPVLFLAKRFAAKEAFAKACGTGFRAPIIMRNISILNDSLGKPYLVLDQRILDWLNLRGIKNYHVSISDEHNLSSAIVILEN